MNSRPTEAHESQTTSEEIEKYKSTLQKVDRANPMPMKLFSRKNAVYFTLGITAMLAFFDWVTADAAQANDLLPQDDNSTALAINNTSQIITMLAVGAAEIVTAFAAKTNYVPDNASATSLQIIENQIRKKIRVHKNKVGRSYTATAQKNDINFIVDTMLDMYQNNILDKCKIDEFLRKKSYEIHLQSSIEVPDEYSQSLSPLAAFAPEDKFIALITNTAKLDSAILASIISHEMRHLVDASNNEDNEVWMFLNEEDQPYASPITYANPKNTNEIDVNILNKYIEAKELIENDVSRILNLYAAHLKLFEEQTQTEQENLAALMILVIKSDYRHTKLLLKMNEIHQTQMQLPENSINYRYDKKRDKYVVDLDMGIARIGGTIELENGESFDLTEHIFEFPSHLPGYMVVTRTNPLNHTAENLVSDLLINLKIFNHIVTKYPERERPYEYGAFFDQALSRHPLLRNYLFPNMTKHEEARYSKDFRACMT
jgi:hypothetical protein